MSNKSRDDAGAEGVSRARIRELWSRQAEALDGLLEMALDDELPLCDGDLASLLFHLHGHITRTGLSGLHHGDPARPELFNWNARPWNFAHSNADTYYLSATISDEHDYRVFGKLGSAAHVTFGVYAGVGDQDRAIMLRAEDVHIEGDGSFELFFSNERRGQNCYPRLEGAQSFACYQLFVDWERAVPGDIAIERLGPPLPERAPSFDSLSSQFERFLAKLREDFEIWTLTVPAMTIDQIEPNSYLEPMQPPTFHAGAWVVPMNWTLQEDEALLIRLRLPEDCAYSGLTMTNRWSQMIDHDRRQTSLNHLQANVDEDGILEVLVSARDHGVRNWLDSAGYASGTVAWRTIASEENEDPPAHPELRVIGGDELRAIVSRMAKVTPEERAAELERRRRHLARLSGGR